MVCPYPSLAIWIQSHAAMQRCWHDAEDLPFISEADTADPLLRPLKQGEVGVSFYPKGAREILHESKLKLVDRSYQPGDLLKRSVDDVQAGVVTRYVRYPVTTSIKFNIIVSVQHRSDRPPGAHDQWRRGSWMEEQL